MLYCTCNNKIYTYSNINLYTVPGWHFIRTTLIVKRLVLVSKLVSKWRKRLQKVKLILQFPMSSVYFSRVRASLLEVHTDSVLSVVKCAKAYPVKNSQLRWSIHALDDLKFIWIILAYFRCTTIFQFPISSVSSSECEATPLT